MPDMTTISAALGSLKTALDITKAIRDSGTTLSEAEINYQIADLTIALADVKTEMAEIQTLLLAKDGEIKQLTEALEIKASVVWEKPYYWTVNDDTRDGPYCQQCYDNDRKLIRLQEHDRGYWACDTCKNSVTDRTYSPQSWSNDYPTVDY